MPNKAENQEISSQQKVEKGSILNYFTKKVVTASQSKLKVANAALNNCNDSNVYKVEKKTVKNTERKNEKNTDDISDKVKEKQMRDGSQGTVDIKKTNKSIHLGVGCHGTGSAVTETVSSDDEDLELKSSKGLDGNAGKLHTSLDKSVTKHKNIFSFMMANRDKQNEVLKKMAEEELINNEEYGNKSEKQGKSFHGNLQVSIKKDEVDVMTVDRQLTKGSKKTQYMNTENSPLKIKKSPRKRSKSHKNNEVLSAKGSKTNRSETIILDDDGDFISSEESQSKSKFVSGCKDFINSEQYCSKYSKNEDSGTRKDIIEVDRSTSDVSTDEDCIKLVAPQTLQNRAATNLAKIQITPPAIIDNAFTLLMTNRHKMNKNPMEKKDELIDEDTCTVELRHLKIQKRKAGKYDEYLPDQRGRKRKKSFSCDLDSSLNDFEETSKKKKRSKRRSGIRKGEGSSTEDEDQTSQNEILSKSNSVIDISCDEIEVSKKVVEDQTSQGEILSQSNSVIGISCDEIEVNSKKVVEDEEGGMAVSYVVNIIKCKEPKNLSDHRSDKSRTHILNVKNGLVGKGKEIKLKGECNSCSVMDEDGERDYTSSDELVSSGNPVEVSGKRWKKHSVKVGSSSKSNMPDSDTQNKIEEETECNNASTSQISNEEDKLRNKVIRGPHKTIESSSSSKKSLASVLREVRYSRRTSDSKYTATLEEGKADKSDGEKIFLYGNVQDKVDEPPTEKEFSVALTSPPKKRRKKGKNMELDDEDNNNRNDCNDKCPVKTESKGDDCGAECSKDEKLNEDNLPVTKKGNIATFFKKMSKEEKAVERSKSVITIKADVHAPCEGYSPNKSRTSFRAGKCSGIPQDKEKTQVRRSSRRLKSELEDFNKIELLEQIQVNSPKKNPGIENVRKDIKGKGVKKASINAEICTTKDNRPSQVHVNDSAPENFEMPVIDTLKRENTNDGSVNKPGKTCKKSESSSQDSEHTKRGGKEEVDDIWQDVTVGKISVKGITTVKGKSKKILKKKQGGKNGQPKLMVNKIKEARSERKVKSNKPSGKKKISQKKQVLNDLSKDKDRKVSGKSDKLDEYQDLNNKLENVGKNKLPLNMNNSVEIVADETSSSSDVICDKEMKGNFFLKRVKETAEDVNDDKENVEQTSQQTAKKCRNVESKTLLKEGSVFQSFDEWSIYLEKLKDDGLCSSIRIRDSRSIDAFAKLSSRMIKPSLKYAYVVYECGYISSEKTKKLVKASQQKSQMKCPWKLKIMPSTDGESLVIKEVCLDHNHSLEKKNKKDYPMETHSDSSLDNELVHVDTSDLSISKSKPSQLKASIGTKKKRQLVVCKVVTKRKMLSSQENLKNQIQTQTKASKTVGKRKKSPKSRNKRLIAEITSLQDDVIEKMAKTNINVSIAVGEEDVNIVNEDSSYDKARKAPSKKSKIYPLVLKPPPKEVEPVKVKDKKKYMKKSLETVRQKGKTDKNPNVNEDRRSVTSRPSRQAAIKVKRMFQDMSSSEDSDISEIETVTRSSLKVTCSKTCKTKDVKLGNTKQDDSTRKEEKLAPIFCRRPKSPEIEVLKTAFSPSKLKARQEFLQSGVPEQIKKQQLLEKSQEEQLTLSAPFPEFNHIQQRDDSDPIWNLHSPTTLSLKEEAENDLPKYRCTSIYQENIFNKTKPLESNSSLTESTSLDVTSVVVILNALKKNNPRFPVFSTFKLYLDQKKEAVESYKRELAREDKISLIDLEEEETKSDKRKRRSKDGLSRRGRKKKGSGKTTRRSEEMQEIEEMPPLPVWQERIPNVWTQVYAPKKGSHVIGNKCHVKKLRRWLNDWKSKSEAFAVKERNKNARLSKKDDGDFTLSEESSSDEEDFVSTYLLCGPPGVGKTAVVYALAAELGYNVLEVNASSKRPGKHVMSQLAEATQSHSVSNSSNQPTNALAAMFAAKSGTQSKKVKNKAFASKEKVSHGCNRDVEKKKGLSVVLFEDIDIVFEESDEGFLSTVNNFMITTKRPIILTLSYASHSALSKIKSSYERLDFEPPPEDLIAQHVQLICLVNGQHICLDDIENLVSVNKCDIRQTLLDVQVWSNFGSSSEKCSCLSNTGSTEDVNLEAVSLSDIFSEKIDTKSKNVETYPKKLWGKVHSRYIADLEKHKHETDISVKLGIITRDSQSITWTQTAKSLPFFLPYTLKENRIIKKYPLQADDPFLRTTYLWQKYNWLSIDEDEDESSTPLVVEKEGNKDQEENIQVPQYVLDSSGKCVASIARFYNTISELDVLESHYHLAQPGKDNSGDWWKRQPIPGLSDLERHYKHWGPYTLTPYVVEEIGHRAFQQCYYESKKYLEDMPITDWSQVSLPVQEKEKPALLESQRNGYERSLKEHEKIDERLITHIPLVHQLSRKGFMDYLCFMRSVIRHNELSAALCKSRRGRRYLSQTSHYGIDLSRGDKIKLANSLCP